MTVLLILLVLHSILSGVSGLLLRRSPEAALAADVSWTGHSITAAVPSISVCAIGDSITDGLQGHDDVYVNRGGFRRILNGFLKDAGGELTGFETCPCPSYPNARSAQIHVQLQKNRFLCGSRDGARPPDIALLMAGTNDLVQHLTVEQTLKNMRDLLQDLWTASPQTAVLLASIPVHQGNPGPFDLYNAGLRQLALELKPVAPIEYVPMSEDTGICSIGLCHTDNIHPTAEGYRAMADEWWKFIQPKIHHIAELRSLRHAAR